MAISDTKYLNNLSAKVQQGKVYVGFINYDSVDDDETIYIRIKAGEKYGHFLIDINTVGQWRFKSYLASTYTVDGTMITPLPRVTDAEETIYSAIYKDPTVNVLGTERFNLNFGSGTRASRVTNTEFNDALETIIEPNGDILLALTNDSGSSQYLSVIMNGYEE